MAAIHGPGSGAEGPSVARAVTGRIVGNGNRACQAAYYAQQTGDPGKQVRRNVHVADALTSKGPADRLDPGQQRGQQRHRMASDADRRTRLGEPGPIDSPAAPGPPGPAWPRWLTRGWATRRPCPWRARSDGEPR